MAGEIDLERSRPRYATVRLEAGLVVEHRGSGIVGAVASWGKGQVVLVDRRGARHRLPSEPGGFLVEGRPATLAPPPPSPSGASGPSGPSRGAGGAALTASGSVVVPRAPARVARASRIYVEGRHDAELIEKVWGDDLRHEGVVVEALDGVDHLAAAIAEFQPGPSRRLGILVDHLVAGSKEQRLAAAAATEGVLVCGHRFIDIWAAVRPRLCGLDAWPDVPRNENWKEGICARLGVSEPALFWRQLLGRVNSYADLDPSLVGAVEQLIDFVTGATEPA